uniref:Uncharacterized protein n=1 Tax=Micrurus spixii TaxID=129469 RepID=A0A2D4MKT0_9SAUR
MCLNLRLFEAKSFLLYRQENMCLNLRLFEAKSFLLYRQLAVSIKYFISPDFKLLELFFTRDLLEIYQCRNQEWHTNVSKRQLYFFTDFYPLYCICYCVQK